MKEDGAMGDRSAEELLVHAGWLRALAFRLVRDDDDADDLVQDTWIASMRRTPEHAESAKSWLAKVMVNRLRMRARSEGRRTAREQATLLIGNEDVPTQDLLVARAEMQRKLVDLVLRLEEPYRSTVLLHYCEGVPLASMGRAQGLAASTVRSRLKIALDRLREGLDAEAGGRKQWAVPLLAIPKGVFVAQKSSKLVAVAILLLLLVGGVLVLRHRAAARDVHRQPSVAAGARVPQGGGTNPIALGASPDQPAWLIQPDVKPRRVAGRVLFKGAPVAGATVELASVATESGLGAPARRSTNSNGEFDFGEQPAMEFSVRASAPKHASAMLAVDLRDPTARPDHLELGLGACDAAMFGTVRDASGGAIAKARIARLNDGSQTSVTGGPAVVADEHGDYEFCVETRWPPWVAVEVSAAGYGAIVYNATVPGRTRVDFALVPEATIVGRVIRDDTREPVVQAFVYVPSSGVEFQRSAFRGTFTDASGHFRIEGLAPGSHLVFARANALADSVRGIPVVVAAGQTSAEIEIRLEAGCTIRGTVVDGSKPVGGARVTAANRTAYSQGDGSYVLTAVPRGDVTFGAPPYDVVKPKTFHVSQPLHDGVEISVESLGTITGLVLRGRTPVPGAAVYLRGPNAFELDPVFADGEGRFVARGLRAGPWDVAAGSQQLGAFGMSSPEIIHVTRGQTVDVTIDMKYAASISGRVVDQNGAPISGVTVGFVHTAANDIGLATTAMDGTFHAATMTGGGQYRPSVSAIASATPWTSPLRPLSGTELPLITLADGSSTVTDVQLAVRLDRLSISGLVVDGDGAPVPDTRVIAELTENTNGPQFAPGAQAPAATTDAEGKFTITDLLDGTYALRARSPAGVEGTVLGVRAGRGSVTLALPSPGGIDATVVGFKTAPQVTALPVGPNSTSAPLQANQEGSLFAFRNLAPGRYLVTARTSTEGVSAIVEVVARRVAKVTLASKGSSVIAGRVREFRSGKPIEGMMCRAVPRVGTMPTTMAYGEGVRTDAQGAFLLDAPVGDIAVWCDGLWSQYSDGLRVLSLSPNQRVDLDVPVVGWSQGVSWTMSGLGAELDERLLVPAFMRVTPRGPAALAGFADGDVITNVDGVAVTDLSPRGVLVLIVNRAPGTKVKVVAMRGDKSVSGEVTLGPSQ